MKYGRIEIVVVAILGILAYLFFLTPVFTSHDFAIDKEVLAQVDPLKIVNRMDKLTESGYILEAVIDDGATNAYWRKVNLDDDQFLACQLYA